MADVVGVDGTAGGNFSSFHQDAGEPLGEAILRLAMTFTTPPIVFIHSSRDYSIPPGRFLRRRYRP